VAPTEASVRVGAGRVDLRRNFFGAFPDVMSAFVVAPGTAIDIDGFVGVPIADTGETGPYVAGDFDEDVEWSGPIVVTGQVRVGAPARLRVAPGTDVRVVSVDQDDDGQGDFEIRIESGADVIGDADRPIVFSAHPATPGPEAWQGLIFDGEAATLEHVRISDAQVGVSLLGPAPHAVSHVELTGHITGLRVGPGSPATLDRVTAEANSIGLHLSGPAVVRDSVLGPNGDAGVVVDGPGVRLAFVDISQNEHEGVRVNSGGGLDLTDSVVAFNRRAGVQIQPLGYGAEPNVTLTHSNVHGNGERAAWRVERMNMDYHLVDPQRDRLTAEGAFVSPPSTDGLEIDYSLTGDGWIYIFDSRAEITLFGSDEQGRFWLSLDHLNNPSFSPHLRQTCCDAASFTLHEMRWRVVDQLGAQLSVSLFDDGFVDARDNYWGVFPDVGAHIVRNDPDHIDFSGFQPLPFGGAGPRLEP